MELSVALILIAFVLIAIPELNQRVDVWVNNILWMRRFKAPAATILFILGFLGLLMGWY